MQPGVLGDKCFGPDGEHIEVRLQGRREVRVGERIAAGDEPGDAASSGPVDRVGRPDLDLGGGHLRGRPLISSRPIFT